MKMGLAWVVNHVEEELNRQAPDTGRFMSGPGWAVTNQDLMLLLAYLYLQPSDTNPYYGSERLLEAISLAGDAIRDFQNPDGKVEFIKVDGSRWGAIYMPWTMYHWLETWDRMKGALSSERKFRWEEGLKLAYAGIFRELREALDKVVLGKEEGASSYSVVHNIPVWNAMGLHRASQHFGEAGWKETADEMLRLAVIAQHPDGYWPEHQGPTTLYNLVYMHALGLYRYHGGAVDVAEALRRGVRFHDAFTYPDGSRVETVDGRVKFEPYPSPMGLVGFAGDPAGRRIAERWFELAMAHNRKWFTAHFAEVLRYWDAAGELSRPSEEPLFERESLAVRHGDALIFKQDGWYVCLSGFAAPQTESRWGQDRQSFIGVWHDACGLIVGGGNSKGQPSWSTFERPDGEGGTDYVPCAGRAELDDCKVVLEYGRQESRGTVELKLAVLDRGRLELELHAGPGTGDQGTFHLPLLLKPEGVLRVDEGEHDLKEAASLGVVLGNAQEHRLGHGCWTMSLTGPLSVEWPSYPFNPYEPEGKSDIHAAIGLLSFSLKEEETKRVVLSIGSN